MAGSTRAPNLTTEMRLYRDGREIARVDEKRIDAASNFSGEKLDDFGIIRITEGTETGDYALQVIVRDKIANRTSSQWVDFEVIDTDR